MEVVSANPTTAATTTKPMGKKKSTLPRTAIKKKLNIMRMDETGAFEILSVTPEGVLDICRECVSERLSNLPFGEVMLRDLRSVDPSAFGTEPKIQVRTLCALVSLDPIHAFLLPDQLILILGEGADAFLHNVKSRLNDLLEEENERKERRFRGSSIFDATRVPAAMHRDTTQSSIVSSSKQSPKPAAQNKDPYEMDEDDDSPTGVRNPLSRVIKRRHSAPDAGRSPRPQQQQPLQQQITTPLASLDSHEGERPFQLIALDALFSSLCVSIEGETTFVELLVKDATNSKKIEHPNKDTYRGLRKAETDLDIFKTRLIAIRKAVNDFFMDDKELAAMSFDSVVAHFGEDEDAAANCAGVDAFTPYLEDQSEAENLSENLLFFLDEKIGKVKQAESFIDIANTNLVLHLSDTNNTLLKVTIMIQAITAGGTICAVVAGIFGMNLYSGLMPDGDEDVTNFWVVFAILLSFMFFFVFGFYYYAHKKGLLEFGLAPSGGGA